MRVHFQCFTDNIAGPTWVRFLLGRADQCFSNFQRMHMSKLKAQARYNFAHTGLEQSRERPKKGLTSLLGLITLTGLIAQSYLAHKLGGSFVIYFTTKVHLIQTDLSCSAPCFHESITLCSRPLVWISWFLLVDLAGLLRKREREERMTLFHFFNCAILTFGPHAVYYSATPLWVSLYFNFFCSFCMLVLPIISLMEAQFHVSYLYLLCFIGNPNLLRITIWLGIAGCFVGCRRTVFFFLFPCSIF